MKTATIVLLFATVATAQNSPTPTNCLTNSNALNCLSATQPQPRRPDTVQIYQQGYQVGQAIGNAVANRRANHWIKKYCKIHPGEAWWYTSTATEYLDGTCPD
jgi:hypothetical protein